MFLIFYRAKMIRNQDITKYVNIYMYIYIYIYIYKIYVVWMKSISRVGGTIHTSKPIRMRNNGDVPPTNNVCRHWLESPGMVLPTGAISPNLSLLHTSQHICWQDIFYRCSTTRKSTYLRAGQFYLLFCLFWI